MLDKKIPNHVGIIMDGNGRWAEKKGKLRISGHKEGIKVVRKTLNHAKNIGIKMLTLYAFSTENWKRPKTEVTALMTMFNKFLDSEVKDLDNNGIKLNIVGSKEGLSKSTLNAIERAEERLKDNDNFILNIAFNYGGRKEIVDAVNSLIKDGVKEVSEEIINKYLYYPNMPEPELIIRTSGEFRTSNFLLWESAYSEYFISDMLWPEFDEAELDKAIMHYRKRERRFGGIITNEE